MPDISMCSQKECPKRLECYRYMAVPSQYWQSYFAPEFGADGCEDFWEIEPGQRLREKIDPPPR